MKTFKIVHLYYDLMNLYGENGNVRYLSKKLEEQDLIIYFHDEEGDKIKLTEENFDDAYESNEWEVKKKNNW